MREVDAKDDSFIVIESMPSKESNSCSGNVKRMRHEIVSRPIDVDPRQLAESEAAGLNNQADAQKLSKNALKREIKAAKKAALKATSKQANGETTADFADPQRNIKLWAGDPRRVFAILSKSEMRKVGIELTSTRPYDARLVYINACYILPESSKVVLFEESEVGTVRLCHGRQPHSPVFANVAALLAPPLVTRRDTFTSRCQSAEPFLGESTCSSAAPGADSNVELTIFSAKLLLAANSSRWATKYERDS
jgi:hypothetical protein